MLGWFLIYESLVCAGSIASVVANRAVKERFFGVAIVEITSANFFIVRSYFIETMNVSTGLELAATC